MAGDDDGPAVGSGGVVVPAGDGLDDGAEVDTDGLGDVGVGDGAGEELAGGEELADGLAECL